MKSNPRKPFPVPLNLIANENTVFNSAQQELMERHVEHNLESLLKNLGIDWRNDPNCAGTPARMAKMYCREIFAGRYTPAPVVTTFPNTKKLDELVLTGPITVRSTCAHHFCPVIGQCWIGVVYANRIAGLSKFNRVVDWLARRPQMQEELVVQIADFIEATLHPKGIAVVLKAQHTCLTERGVNECRDSMMSTNVMRGVFRQKPEARAEFFASLALHR